MTGIKRWIDEGAPEGMRELLVAASTEMPDETSTEKALALLGVAGAMGLGAHGPVASMTAVKGTTGTSQLTLALKWGLSGVMGALVTAGAGGLALHAMSDSHHAPAAVSGTHANHARSAEVPVATAVRRTAPENVSPAFEQRAAPAPEVEVTASSPRASSELPASPSTVPRPADRPIAAFAAGDDSAPLRANDTELLAEVAAVDAARSALARRDPRRTLWALDDYTARFKLRRFDPEALYIRMEALGMAGDRDGQRSVAERLLAAFPSAPQAERARAVLGAAR